MQTFIYKVLLLSVLVLSSNWASAQTTVGTTSTFTNNNGTGGCSFNIENANGYDIIITDVQGMPGVSGSSTAEFWLYNSALTGAPPALTTANGWTQVATNSFTSVASVLQPILTNVSITIPANSTRGVVIFCTSQRYYTMPSSPYNFSGGGVTLKFASSFSYGNGTPPAAPSIASRGWIGNITFKPACINPSGLATTSVTSNSVGFNWSPVPNSLGYEYAVTTSATPPASGTPTLATNGSGIGLSSNTNYYIHVRNSCTGGSYSNWSTIQFTTLVNPCASPTGVIANAPTASSANFSWNAMPGTLGYEYVVNQVAAPPLGAGTPTMSNSATATGLTGGATYYIHIRQQCSSTGGTWSDWTSVQFIMPECEEPQNILFSNITSTDVDIIWSTMAAANYYQYQVDQTPNDPTAGGSGYSTTSSMSAHVGSLTPNTWYYVHIRSMCFVNDSSDWALDSFVTAPFCAPPALSVNNANTNSPDGYWQPVASAFSYEWAFNASTIPPAFGNETFNTFTPVIALPEDGKDYYLHARTKCNSMFEFSTWSTVPLRTSMTNVSNINASGSINIYPNPAGDFIYIELAGTAKAEGNISVYNIVGQNMMSEQLEKNGKLDVSSLPKGIYTLRYDTGAGVLQSKFIKQ